MRLAMLLLSLLALASPVAAETHDLRESKTAQHSDTAWSEFIARMNRCIAEDRAIVRAARLREAGIVEAYRPKPKPLHSDPTMIEFVRPNWISYHYRKR